MMWFIVIEIKNNILNNKTKEQINYYNVCNLARDIFAYILNYKIQYFFTKPCCTFIMN